MLSFTQFKNEVSKNIKSALSEEFAECEVVTHTVNKPEGSYEGVSVKDRESGIYPTVNLNSFYDEYIGGKEIEECIGDIATIIENNSHPEFGFNPMNIVFWDKAKARIVPYLMNIPNNKEYLSDKITRDISDDMTMVFAVVVNEDEQGVFSTKVTNDLLDTWNITAVELYETAIGNLADTNYRFGTIFDAMSNELPIGGIENASDSEPMYILTNEKRQFGATMILRNDIMETLSQKLGNFYILPSSVHEVIICPAVDGIDPNGFVSLVNDINGDPDIMDTSDVLSNKVYRYNKDTKKIETI